MLPTDWQKVLLQDRLSPLLSRRLHIFVRCNIFFNQSIFIFKRADAFPYQHKNMTVNTSALIVSDIGNLIQHFLFNSY